MKKINKELFKYENSFRVLHIPNSVINISSYPYKTIEGFDIHFEPLEEDIPLADLLPDDTPAQIRGLNRRIENGNTVLFCAQVWAEKCGVKLSDNEYLGGCIYKSYEDFYNKDCYFDDMANTCIDTRTVQGPRCCHILQPIYLPGRIRDS